MESFISAVFFCLTSCLIVSVSSYRPVCDPDCGNLIFDCGLRSPFSFSCPNGFERDNCGCQTSCNCAGCEPFDKTIPCPAGKKLDERGCPTNVCKCPTCAPNDCGLVQPEFSIICPDGNVLDVCGCVQSCQCAGCPSFSPSISCPFGRKTGVGGCPTNMCNPPPAPVCQFASDCAAVTCFADFGNAVDEEGCPLRGCPCQGAASCPALPGCTLDCSMIQTSSPFPPSTAYRTDDRGCVLCQCDTPSAPVCEFASDCAAVSCPAEFGNAVDDNGCPLKGCPCQGAANCPALPGCTVDCSGIQVLPTQPADAYRRDDKGCVTCLCECDIRICLIFCEFSRLSDENGCDICACAPAPTTPVERPGSCPQYGVWGRTVCENDQDCPGSEKCCQMRNIRQPGGVTQVCSRIRPTIVRRKPVGEY